MSATQRTKNSPRFSRPRHSAATPIGANVTASATYRGRDGKLFVFDVIAHDPGGEIGWGTHKRAIISRERLLAGAARRL